MPVIETEIERSFPAPASLAHSWELSLPSERALTYASLVLLSLTSLEIDLVQNIATALWLISVCLLAFINVGAGFGVMLASVALHASRHFEGWGTIFQRPDNFAMFFVLLGLLYRCRNDLKLKSVDFGLLSIGAFVLYGLLHGAAMGLLTRGEFAWYMRMFGIPLVFFVLLMRARFQPGEFGLFAACVAVVGAVMVAISLVERIDTEYVFFPPWFHDADINVTLDTGRSGGLLMQSEWNGLALSLVFCVLVLGVRRRMIPWRLCATGIGLACLVAIFFTYTRAAWLAMAIAFLILLAGDASNRGSKTLRRLAVTCGVVAGGVLLVAFPTQTAQQRMGDSGTVHYRMNLWSTALNMAAQRPIFGYGFAQFGLHAGDYHSRSSNIPFVNIDEKPVVHNTPMSVLVELGGVGLVLYALAMLQVCWLTYKAVCRRWGWDGVVWLAAFAAVYFCQTQFVIAHDPTTNLLFFGTLGGLAGLRGNPEQGFEQVQA